MFGRVRVSLSPNRQYSAYVCGEHVEIMATIDGHTARLGTAHWNGQSFGSCSVRLPADAAAALTEAILRTSESPTS